jgi:hypothetical protein
MAHAADAPVDAPLLLLLLLLPPMPKVDGRLGRRRRVGAAAAVVQRCAPVASLLAVRERATLAHGSGDDGGAVHQHRRLAPQAPLLLLLVLAIAVTLLPMRVANRSPAIPSGQIRGDRLMQQRRIPVVLHRGGLPTAAGGLGQMQIDEAGVAADTGEVGGIARTQTAVVVLLHVG